MCAEQNETGQSDNRNWNNQHGKTRTHLSTLEGTCAVLTLSQTQEISQRLTANLICYSLKMNQTGTFSENN
jgi:hypothetical protein